MFHHSDIRRAVSDFVAEAKSLCERMLLSDRMNLNVMDLHILRTQLKVLDAEASNLEYLVAANSAGKRTKITAKKSRSHNILENQAPRAHSQKGAADSFKRAAS